MGTKTGSHSYKIATRHIAADILKLSLYRLLMVQSIKYT